MSVYAVEELMTQTRKLAADYYRTMKQSLPVSAELAKYDACRLLNLREVEEAIKGVDAVDDNACAYQVKSRVIFQEGRSGYRIGQLNMDGEWQKVVLVLFNPEYEPFEIHVATREAIDNPETTKSNPKREKRGAMSVAKFKNIGQLLWTKENGLEQMN